MPEQRLGILGGMGSQATQDFYQRILDRTDASCDQEYLPTLTWSDTSMPDRTVAILDRDVEGCYRRLLDGAKLLEWGGCTALVTPCNTSHYLADRLRGGIAIPFIHMSREIVDVLAADGKERTGILATDGMVQTGIYQRECATRGMEGVTPLANVQKLVTSITYDEIKRGEKGSWEKFTAIDRWLRASGRDVVILGCIELSVYRTYHGLSDHHLDAMEILAERCITACSYRLRTV